MIQVKKCSYLMIGMVGISVLVSSVVFAGGPMVPDPEREEGQRQACLLLTEWRERKPDLDEVLAGVCDHYLAAHQYLLEVGPDAVAPLLSAVIDCKICEHTNNLCPAYDVLIDVVKGLEDTSFIIEHFNCPNTEVERDAQKVGRALALVARGVDDPRPKVRSMILSVIEKVICHLPSSCLTSRSSKSSVKWQLGKAIVPYLVNWLEQPEESRRREAFALLMKIGPAAREAEPALVELLNDPIYRLSAVRTLSRIGVPSEAAVDRIGQMLETASERARPELYRILAGFGRVAARLLPRIKRQMLSLPTAECNRDFSVRVKSALELLNAVRGWSAEEFLPLVLDTEMFGCKYYPLDDAAKFLTRLGPGAKVVVPKLAKWIGDPSVTWWRRAVIARAIPATRVALASETKELIEALEYKQKRLDKKYEPGVSQSTNWLSGHLMVLDSVEDSLEFCWSETDRRRRHGQIRIPPPRRRADYTTYFKLEKCVDDSLCARAPDGPASVISSCCDKEWAGKAPDWCYHTKPDFAAIKPVLVELLEDPSAELENRRVALHMLNYEKVELGDKTKALARAVTRKSKAIESYRWKNRRRRGLMRDVAPVNLRNAIELCFKDSAKKPPGNINIPTSTGKEELRRYVDVTNCINNRICAETGGPTRSIMQCCQQSWPEGVPDWCKGQY